MIGKKTIYLSLLAIVSISVLFSSVMVLGATETLLEESFEQEGPWDWQNWDDITSSWYRGIVGRINTHSAAARFGAFDGQLTCNSLDTSDADSIYVEFWYMNYGVGPVEPGLETGDYNLYYWDGSDYILVADLSGSEATTPTWVRYTDTITDSEYLISDFRIRFNAIMEVGEDAWVDGVNITKNVPSQKTLTLRNVGSGVTNLDIVGPYEIGTTVTLTAVPETGWEFVGWGGALSGITNPTTLNMDEDKAVGAYFSSTAIISLSLSASYINRGSTISSSISGGTDDGGVMIQIERSGQLLWADQETLSPTGQLDYALKIPSTWIDGTYTVRAKDIESGTITSKTFAIPVPAPPPEEYTLSVNTAGSGSVTRNPSLPSYVDGSTVILTASPSTGYVFTGWSGDLSGSTNPASVTMDTDKTITATFTEIPSSGGGPSGGGVGIVLPSPVVISILKPKAAADELDGFSAKGVASVLDDVTDVLHVAEIIEYFDPAFAADVLGNLPLDLALEILALMDEEKVLEILVEMDDSHTGVIAAMLNENKEATALKIEAAVKSKIEGLGEGERKLILEKLGQALGSLDTNSLIDLFIYIAELPETPSTVAYIIEAMPFPKSLDLVSLWLTSDYSAYYPTLANVMSFVSNESLSSLYRGMVGNERTIIYEYLSAGTILRLPTIGTFEISDLQIIPDEVEKGDDVYISAVLTNIGTETDNYVIPLKINDLTVTTFSGIASTNQPIVLQFMIVTDSTGNYNVEILEETGHYTVIEKTEPPPVPELKPAELGVTLIEIIPNQVVSGKTISIFVTITNEGGETGSEDYELSVDSATVDSKSITVEASSSEILIYVLEAEYSEGVHNVKVGEAEAVFTIMSPPSTTPWITIIAVAIVLLIGVGYLIETRTGSISSLFNR